MSQIGTSGRPILLRADFSLGSEFGNGTVQYILHGRFTEPYANGGPFDGETVISTVNTVSLQLTDSEIIASNKDVTAAYIADRFMDPTFTAGDIRGGDVL